MNVKGPDKSLNTENKDIHLKLFIQAIMSFSFLSNIQIAGAVQALLFQC